MIGGVVLENARWQEPVKDGDWRCRIWVMDPKSFDELIVYVDEKEGANIKVCDVVWWQGRVLYWTRLPDFEDRPVTRIGNSHRP